MKARTLEDGAREDGSVAAADEGTATDGTDGAAMGAAGERG